MVYVEHGLPYMGMIAITRLFKFFWRDARGFWMPRGTAYASGQYVRAIHKDEEGWSLAIDNKTICTLDAVWAHTPGGPQRALVGAFGLAYYVILRNPPPPPSKKPYRGPCATLYLSATPPRIVTPDSIKQEV